MMRARTRSRRGYTLIELLVSIAIATALATLAMSAFLQIRSLVGRAESRIAMHAGAQGIYGAMHRAFTSTAPGCAMVVYATPVTVDPVTGLPNGGDVTIIFMHFKEDTEDWEWTNASIPKPVWMDSDMLWEQWKWNAATATLYCAESNPARGFSMGGTSFKPNGSTDYMWHNFDGLPQPRRTLNAVDAASLRVSMDDNIYFPNTVAAAGVPAWTTSKANPGDVGDYEELQQYSEPALTQVTGFAVQVCTHDGTVLPSATTAVDGSAAQFYLFPGVWPDGRIGDTLVLPNGNPAPQTYAGSAIAKRPELIRIRFTMNDTKVGLIEPFSFSFALPAVAPSP